MIAIADYRRFYADELRAIANLGSPALVEALAVVPRERFLPPGPWTVRSEVHAIGGACRTPDADPRHVHHNVAVALDDARTLFNGAPSLLAMALDNLAIEPGARVLHVGAGAGYYTALAAHCTGRGGRVVGIEIDADLATTARANLADMPWVEIRCGDGSAPLDGPFDAVLINAGVTHPLDAWLDALAPGGRMILPVTATVPGMGTLGKGVLVRLSQGGSSSDLAAHVLAFVAIYSALGIRDESLNVALGRALARHPLPRLGRLRRDTHDADDRCWLHGPTWCLSLDGPA